MPMKNFVYYEPENIVQALEKKVSSGNKAQFLAGGTDLLVRMKRGLLAPTHVINLKSITGLKEIHADNELKMLRIGSLVTLAEVESSPIVAKYCPLLVDTVSKMASPQIRSIATLGGNICSASPAADTAPVLLAQDSLVKVESMDVGRTVPIKEFFVGPGQTIIKENELLGEVLIPWASPNSAASYIKYGVRKSLEIAMVGVAACLNLQENGCVEKARIALGAVAPTPIRAFAAESLLQGKKLNGSVIEEAINTSASEAKPISDHRGSATYRKEMVKVLVRRAINECAAKLQ